MIVLIAYVLGSTHRHWSVSGAGFQSSGTVSCFTTAVPGGGAVVVEVAVTSSTLAVVLGTLARHRPVRFARFPGRLLLDGMVNAPLVMPRSLPASTQLLLFVSMLQMFSWPHRGFTTLVIAHVAFCTAYVTITGSRGCRARTAPSRRRHGWISREAFVEITLPIIAPALVSGWLLSFTHD